MRGNSGWVKGGLAPGLRRDEHTHHLQKNSVMINYSRINIGDTTVRARYAYLAKSRGQKEGRRKH